MNHISGTHYVREDRIADYDSNGNLIISYTHGPAIDEPAAMTINGSTYFYIPDIQGSIRAIADAQGNLMASYVYDVWGNLISHDGPLSEKNDYMYTAREYDWETGIYYYRARSYDPELGRFLQQDPERMVDGPNMYVYVGNDPGNGVDAWGKYTVENFFGGKSIILTKEESRHYYRLKCEFGGQDAGSGAFGFLSSFGISISVGPTACGLMQECISTKYGVIEIIDYSKKWGVKIFGIKLFEIQFGTPFLVCVNIFNIPPGGASGGSYHSGTWSGPGGGGAKQMRMYGRFDIR